MKIYIDILLATLIVVFIVDLSGFPANCKEALGRWLNIKVGHLKPFDCSLCMTWWVCIIIALVEHCLSFPVLAYIATLAFLADTIGMTMQIAKESIKKLLTTLYNFTQR